MRWFEREFADYERMMKEQTGASSLNQLNEIAAKISIRAVTGSIFLPYMSGERSPIWNPYAKGVFYGLDFAKTKGHMVRACMEGVALSLRHNLEVARGSRSRCRSLKSNGRFCEFFSLDTDQIRYHRKTDHCTGVRYGNNAWSGTPCRCRSRTSTKIMMKPFPLTVKETRRHEPNPENKDSV